MSLETDSLRAPREGHARIVAIDIGIKNLAFYVEDVPLDALQQLKAPTKKESYLPNGTATQITKEVLDRVCREGEAVLFALVDLVDEEKNSVMAFNFNLFVTLGEYLRSKTKVWDTCNCFLIEKQLYKMNVKAERLSQFCFSFFTLQYRGARVVTFVNASMKTRVLGCSLRWSSKRRRWVAPDKPSRKKWCVERCFQILFSRRDYAALTELSHYHKRDDLADCVCMLQAFKYLALVCKRFKWS